MIPVSKGPGACGVLPVRVLAEGTIWHWLL